MKATGMRLIFVAMLLALAGHVAAQPAAPAKPSYIADAHLDATQFLAAPPRPKGLAQAADMAAVKAAQAQRGHPRWALAKADDAISPFSAFGPVLGPAFTKEHAPKTAALFDILFADVATLTVPAKIRFDRPRPPLVDTRLKTCMPLEQTRSYPSGHATRGWLMALVLSEMAPEKANALLARGRDYGDSRVVCAEHFPSDVEAGRLIGSAVFAAAKADPGFERDLADARTELRAALGL